MTAISNIHLQIIVTISLAFTGYIVTYLNNLRIQKRNDKLKYINQQLENFYGPLFVLSQIGQILFEVYWHKTEGLIEKDNEWHIWVENVFFPLNNELEKLIISKAYLINESDIPTPLLNFLAHNAGYKSLIIKWKNNDFSEHHSIIPFPNGLEEYAKKSYIKIKKEQLKILNKRW